MDSQCLLEVMAGTKSAGVVAEDKENKTTDGIEKKGESKVISTTTPNRPPVRESAKRVRDQMMKWSKILNAPPGNVKDYWYTSYHST